jgi:molybdopterin-guanine dinucleotide biosynthesis protein A
VAPDLTGILLVGGASRRFGSPKALAVFEGETLAARAWRVLGASCHQRIAVGKREDGLHLPFDVEDDAAAVRAPLAGIVAGLRQSRTELAIVVPVDMPFVRPTHLRQLAAACTAGAALPQSGPLPCALRTSALPFLERRLFDGELKLRDIFAGLETATVGLDPAALANINTPEELAAHEVRIVPLLAEHRPGFRELVASTLAEYGFEADEALDPDLDDPAAFYAAVWVAVNADVVVGSVALRRVGPRAVELKRMYLRDAFRGRGLGRRLLEMALLWAREHRIELVSLDTTERMAEARRLYEAYGFVRVAGSAPRQGQERMLYELRL